MGMNPMWPIQAFIDAHTIWRGMRDSLSVMERDGWFYILFQGSEIGRVQIQDRNIVAEALWTHSHLGEE